MSLTSQRRQRPQQRDLELLGEKWPTNLAESSDFHAFFRDLLHTANLRHGADGFTSPPKEGVMRIFFRPEKSDGFGRVRTRELGISEVNKHINSARIGMEWHYG